jgi:hypothetical protein
VEFETISSVSEAALGKRKKEENKEGIKEDPHNDKRRRT